MTGKLVYGELYRFSFATMIKSDGVYYPVKNIAKLVGYDKDGNEVWRKIK